MSKVTVLGGGGWAIALAVLLNDNKHDVTIWSALPREVEALTTERENKVGLPGVIISEDIVITGDIESAVTFLKARCGTLFKESELLERRQQYIEYLAQNPSPEVEQNSKYILNYGEYIEDIVKLFEVCGRLDKKSAPKGFEGIYYSEETALLMAMGALDEFGDVAQHLYYVPPFGTQDSDRETLVYYHNKGYSEGEKAERKQAETSSEKQSDDTKEKDV